eukprot:1679215-Rhodomonas_salina.1
MQSESSGNATLHVDIGARLDAVLQNLEAVVERCVVERRVPTEACPVPLASGAACASVSACSIADVAPKPCPD